MSLSQKFKKLLASECWKNFFEKFSENNPGHKLANVTSRDKLPKKTLD